MKGWSIFLVIGMLAQAYAEEDYARFYCGNYEIDDNCDAGNRQWGNMTADWYDKMKEHGGY